MFHIVNAHCHGLAEADQYQAIHEQNMRSKTNQVEAFYADFENQYFRILRYSSETLHETFDVHFELLSKEKKREIWVDDTCHGNRFEAYFPIVYLQEINLLVTGVLIYELEITETKIMLKPFGKLNSSVKNYDTKHRNTFQFADDVFCFDWEYFIQLESNENHFALVSKTELLYCFKDTIYWSFNTKIKADNTIVDHIANKIILLNLSQASMKLIASEELIGDPITRSQEIFVGDECKVILIAMSGIGIYLYQMKQPYTQLNLKRLDNEIVQWIKLAIHPRANIVMIDQQVQFNSLDRPDVVNRENVEICFEHIIKGTNSFYLTLSKKELLPPYDALNELEKLVYDCSIPPNSN